ncbi:zinc finger protein 721-like [Piliocolobus tephrosceles]|uniref:zinc finger protein 721-like n=1 Tax=Piliocolobus tephrosceles TaxID=591936 RepID=UPI001300E47B|nr:zinc finger protein 721-like [Piliocolobus tephrosceles]
MLENYRNLVSLAMCSHFTQDFLPVQGTEDSFHKCILRRYEKCGHENLQLRRDCKSMNVCKVQKGGYNVINQCLPNTQSKIFQCNAGVKVFSTFANSDKDKTRHTGEKHFKCNQYGKSFQKFSDITQHKGIHAGEKPYTCEECGKTFGRSTALNQHKKIHTGEKPYTCEETGKAFSRSRNLAAHKRIYTGEKLYTCEDRGRAFGCSTNLNECKKIHIGDKPYKCKERGEVFKQSSDLNRQEKIHTRKKPIKCKVCGKVITSSSSFAQHKRSNFEDFVHSLKRQNIVLEMDDFRNRNGSDDLSYNGGIIVSVVLLDELFTRMDPEGQQQMWQILQATVKNKERGAILTTHYMSEAKAVCDSVAIMVSGTLSCIGSIQHLKNKFGKDFY